MRYFSLISALTIGLIAHSNFALASIACEDDNPLTIISATDDGLFDESYGAHNVLDGNFDPESRWSNLGQGEPKYLLLNLGTQQLVKSVSIAWYKGNERKATYAIEASPDGQSFTKIVDVSLSSGSSVDFERNNITPIQAQFIRIAAEGNDSNEWNSIVEVAVSGCGAFVAKPEKPVLTARATTGLFGLDPAKTPGENFDLLGWYVTTPADDNGDGKSDSVYEKDLAAGWTDERYFYTDPVTGGMVFRVTPAGAKTSKNTNYTRTELRGMLRRGDDAIATRGANDYPNKNNWVFSSAPLEAKFNSAGVDGTLRATLAVNQVTRMGKDYQIGRVIIGQIHAKDDEPIRLYYRKLPGNKNGSLYFAHAPALGKERWVTLVGNRSDRAKNPKDGIALDEIFSYEISTEGIVEGDKIIPYLNVKIIKEDGTEIKADPFDMSASGFSVDDEFMFFKAGAYTGNNSSPYPERDFDMVTFYKLDYEHDAPPKGAWIEKVIAEEKARAEALESEGTPPHPAKPGIIMDDRFADGDRTGGVDELDGIWWTTSASSAIDIAPGQLGLVSGGAGRGIRTTFTPQTLSDGQTLQAIVAFTTPDTVGSDRMDALRFGFHDRLERAELEADLSASSGAPNELYNGLPGYMFTFDVNRDDPTLNNVEVRRHIRKKRLGRLMGTYQGYKLLAEGGDSFTFKPNTTYQAVFKLRKTEAGLLLSATLLNQDGEMTSFSYNDEQSNVNNFGMMAFHVNSKTFGSSSTPEKDDNGIKFSHVKLEVLSE